MTSKEDRELHQIDDALTIIDAKLQRLEKDKARLVARREVLVQRKRGEAQPRLEGWDVT